MVIGQLTGPRNFVSIPTGFTVDQIEPTCWVASVIRFSGKLLNLRVGRHFRRVAVADMKHEVAISGMTCESCVGRVTDALQTVPVVTDVSVSLKPPVARLELSGGVKMRELREAVRSVGDYDINKKSEETSWLQTYFPLLLVVGFITLGTVLLGIRIGTVAEKRIMTDFMGLFFVVFSFFKFLDIRGFAKAFRSYDLIAENNKLYGYAYPFIELTLGIMYLGNWFPMAVNFVTLILMLLGTLGVAAAIKSKRKIQCACLGTVFKLPMSKVTLVENLSMAVMALLVLFRLVM